MARQAVELEQRHDSDVQEALADERARIARELHDVVAHSVSLMVLQAGAARQAQDWQPARARQPLLFNGDAPGVGHGLIGMRERTALYGGMFEAGPRSDGGFDVKARLPIDPG